MTKNDFTQDGSIKGFFQFMEERQKIYVKKERGEPKPWTDDPVLRDYFFCNVYREQDKVTKWIATNWRNKDAKPELIIFNMVVARFFNWIPTLKVIGFVNEWPRSSALIEGEIIGHQEMGHQIFNSAYLVAGTDFKGKNKITGVCDRLDWAWEHRKMLAGEILENGTLEFSWGVLQSIPGVAGFLAYEIVTDLRHTPLLDKAPDIMTWANPGPGAIRGLQRIHGREAVTSLGALPLMRTLLESAPKHTPLKLEMRDIEHTLCEADKYWRIENGQSKAMRRYRNGA